MLLIIAIVLHLSLAAWLMRYLLRSDKGNREPAWALVTACLLGIVSIILASIGNELFTESYHTAVMVTHSLGDAWSTGWRVGVIEELAKAVPVGIFAYRQRFFNESTDGVIYFGLAALVFGAAENILYSLAEGGGTGITRIFMTPFFHVATTAFVGYYVARWRLGRSQGWMILAAFVGAAGLHGIYDASLMAGESYPILILVAILLSLSTTIGIFVIYAKAHKSDLALGLATDGARAFCRHCGRPNPHHDLYCASCGQKA